MATQIKTIGINGIEGYVIDVQVKLLNGVATMNIVGLGDVAVKEARDRIESAFVHLDLKFPKKKIVVNLSPSDIKKTGTSYDLPMLVGLLLESDQIKPVDINFNELIFIGEVGLSGDLNHTRGILPMVVEAKRRGFKKIILPKASLNEAKLVRDIQLFGFSSLEEVVMWLEHRLFYKLEPSVKITESTTKPVLDYRDVKGHQHILDYVAIAAAGNHNMLMVGPPGCGKSMIAKRIPTILPELTEEEALEVMAIHSVAGTLKQSHQNIERPFRAPHYNASPSAIIGGGSTAMPGEISLAHNGVLFLDEFPEYSRQTLESLRQPLEDQKVTIARVKQTNTFPANFILIAAMNPCPCGYYGSEKCTCTTFEIKKYRHRISGPIFDRIDIQKYMSFVDLFKESTHQKTISSEEMLVNIRKARQIQSKRFKHTLIRTNSQMEAAHIHEFCKLSQDSHTLLQKAYERFSFSARAYNSLIKVARTSADLKGQDNISAEDIRVALMARDMDKDGLGGRF